MSKPPPAGRFLLKVMLSMVWGMTWVLIAIFLIASIWLIPVGLAALVIGPLPLVLTLQHYWIAQDKYKHRARPLDEGEGVPWVM